MSSTLLFNGSLAAPPALATARPPTSIPQSDFNPLAQEMLVPEAQVRAALATRERWDLLAEKAAITPDAFFQEHPFQPLPGEDTEARKKRLTNRVFLRSRLDGRALPSGDLGYEVTRARIARALFEGRGADDDAAFHGEVLKHVQKAKDKREVAGMVADEAAAAALTGAVDPAKRTAAWKTTREKLKLMPGYDAADEADHVTRFRAIEREVRGRMAPYAGELAQVWEAVQKDTVGQTVAEVYGRTTPAEREGLKNALGLLARSMPKEQQVTFFGSWGKQIARDAVNIPQAAAAGLTTEVQKGGTVGWQDFFGTDEEVRKRDLKDAATAREYREKTDFLADVRDIAEGVYDPVKAPHGGLLGTVERGVFAAPGAVASTLVGFVPVVGNMAFYGMAREDSYQSIRKRLVAGGFKGDAAAVADDLATVAAIPYALADKLGAETIAARMPWFNRLVTGAADRVVKSALARAGARTVAGGAMETATETGQDYLPLLVLDIATGIQAKIPDVTWNGPGGVFDGGWTRSIETFVAMLPLAMFGAAQGHFSDQQLARLKAATDTELKALGYNDAAIAAMRGTTGPATLRAEVIAANATRDPNSPEAKAAVAELDATLKAQAAAGEALKASGVLPDVVVGADGYQVRDAETREIIGTAPDAAGAMRIASAHSAAINDAEADHVAYLMTTLEAAKAAVALDPQSTVSVELSKVMTEAAQAAEDPASLDRFREQQRLRELAQGGTGDVSDVALGASATVFRERVRETANRIFQGGSVLTVFHETGHGLRRAAHAAGVLTRADDLALLRAVDAVMDGKAMRHGAQGERSLRLIPEGVADADVTETMIDEGIAEILEMEVMRTRAGGRKRPDGHGIPSPVNRVAPGIISRNLSALARLAGDQTVGKWKAFSDAVRGLFGLAAQRALALRKAERDGLFDTEAYDAYLDRLTNTSAQRAHETEAAGVAGEILGDNPFSIGRIPDGVRKDTIDRHGNSGADIDDATGLPLNPDGTVTLYHGTTKEGAAEIIRSKTLKADAERRVYLTTDPTAGAMEGTSGYGDGTVVAVNVRPDVLELDDEFPDGRKDFAIDAPKKSVRVVNAFVPEIATQLQPPPFSEDNRLTNLNPDGATMAAILRENPGFDPAQPTVTVWRSAIGTELRRNDYVGLTKAIAEEHLQNLSDRGETGKLTSHTVNTADLLMANDATEFVWSPFDQSPPAASGAFSLAPSAMVSRLNENAISLIRNPRERAEAYQRLSRKLGDLRLAFERLELVAGSKRRKASLRKEAAVREALRTDELVNEAWGRHGAILSDEDLTRLKAQPVHEHLADPNSKMRGRLMSKGRALQRAADLFLTDKGGEWDGAEGISRAVFGGSLLPDQAAQELYDAHLIKEPTPDAMWDAIRREQAQVDKMKEALRKAEDELRDAKRQAKRETNDWLKEQEGTQAAEFSDKQEILRALAVLDGVLSVVPADIRGKVGGYTQLAALGSNETRLEFLKRRLAMVDKEMEKWLSAQYDFEFRDLLKRTRPAKEKPGEKPKGTIGADLHEVFRAVEASMRWSAAEVEAQALALESLAASGTLSAEDEANAITQANLIRLAGNWSPKYRAILDASGDPTGESVLESPGADAARREQAVIEAARIIESGYWTNRLEAARKRAARAAMRHRMEAATGKAGTREERRRKAADEAGLKGGKGWLPTIYDLMSFEQVLNFVFGETSEDAARFASRERWASDRKTDAIDGQTDALAQLYSDLAGGGLKGSQLAWRMAQSSLTIRGETFSEMEAVQATLMWRQEDGQRHMLGHQDENGNYVGKWHYDQAFVDEIEAKLSPEAREVRLFLIERYAAEYDRLNPIYRELNGVNLPRNRFYSPLTVKPVETRAGADVDPVTGAPAGLAWTPGSLKNRSADAIAEPDFRDAAQTWLAHTKQLEHWMAYAPLVQDLQTVIGNRDVRNAMEAKAGKESVHVLSKWVEYFGLGGTRDAQQHLALNRKLLDKVASASGMALIGRVGVLAVQSTQLGAALAEMPTGAYLKRLGMLFSGQLAWGDALRSDYIQRRLAILPPAVRMALDGLHASKPNAVKHAMAKVGTLIGGADAFFTAGTYAITLDYHRAQLAKAGVSGAELEREAHQAAQRSCDRVAQPVRPGARSFMEVSETRALGRLGWAFASEARQKLGLVLYAAANKDVSWDRKARAAAVAWVIGGAMTSLIRAAWRDMRDDDDEEWFDEKNWGWRRLLFGTLTGPLNGIPGIGDALEGTVAGAMGQYAPEGNLLTMIPNAAKAGKRLLWDGPKDWEHAIADAERLLMGIGFFSDTAAALAEGSHIVRDAFSLLDNLVD